jgi:5-formyltetrahydrofolate cyclo-ligase
VSDAKSELRAAMRARRSAIPAGERAAAAAAIAERALAHLAAQPGAAVAGFLSIGEEIDTLPTLSALAAAGHPLCLPVMQGKAAPLLFRAWAPGDAVTERMWGIREPLATKPAVVPDVLLVPLLAFDRAGWRLGYGGGFYDRTLRFLRQRGRGVVAMGLAFDAQEVDAVPHLDYDEPLDWVLTPTRLVHCTR